MCAGSESDFWSGWKLGSPENSGAGEQHHQEWALQGQEPPVSQGSSHPPDTHIFPDGPIVKMGKLRPVGTEDLAELHRWGGLLSCEL